MILPHADAAKFFKLFDLLTVYAHRRLRVVAEREFWDGTAPRGISENGQRLTTEELWSSPEVIDDYVRDNPDSLTPGELAVVASWRHAFSSQFDVDLSFGKQLLFFAGGRAFEVRGLSREVSEMLAKTPTFVQATLLPFGNYVVYAMFLSEYSIEMSESLLAMIADERQRVLASGGIVRTGEEFLEVVPQIVADEEQRRLDEFRRDIELAELEGAPVEGQHVGALAGLGSDEREAAIRAHTDELNARDEQEGGKPKSPAEILASKCTPGPVTGSLANLLATESLPDASTVAGKFEEAFSVFDLSGADSEGEAARELADQADRLQELRDKMLEMIEAEGAAGILAAELGRPEALQQVVSGLLPGPIRDLRGLAEAGGQMRVPKAQVTSLKGLPNVQRGLCYVFLEGDEFVFVMPDEVVETARHIDWDEAEKTSRDRDNLIKFFEAIVDLRGMVPYADAIYEYVAMYPDAFATAQEIDDELMDAVEQDLCGVSVLDTGDEIYLLHYELMWEYLKNRGIDPSEEMTIEEGGLDELLKGLLAQQRGKPPRPLEPDMLDRVSLFFWREEQPACLALRDYLDAHVPDGEDDFLFADSVMESLIEDTKWGLAKGSVQFFFEVLEERGFIPEEHQVSVLLEMWQNMNNSLPCWPNNGWSPNDLLSNDLGRKVFFNEDGSMMKVGRNDPCPCGSGKKYKRCCGRPGQ